MIKKDKGVAVGAVVKLRMAISLSVSRNSP